MWLQISKDIEWKHRLSLSPQGFEACHSPSQVLLRSGERNSKAMGWESALSSKCPKTTGVFCLHCTAASREVGARGRQWSHRPAGEETTSLEDAVLWVGIYGLGCDHHSTPRCYKAESYMEHNYGLPTGFGGIWKQTTGSIFRLLFVTKD